MLDDFPFGKSCSIAVGSNVIRATISCINSIHDIHVLAEENNVLKFATRRANNFFQVWLWVPGLLS